MSDKKKTIEGTTTSTPVTPKRRGHAPKERPVIQFVEGIPRGEVVDVPMEEIDLKNTEFEFRVDHKIKDLLEDVARNGQQFPVILRQIEGRAKYQLVSGFRRCRVIKALGWSTVRAIVRTDLDDDAAYRISFIENERRKSLTGIDKAHAIVKLRLRGKSTEEIGEIYGIGYRQIHRYEQVSEFPKVLRQAIIDGLIETTHSLALMKAHQDHGDQVDMEEWIHAIKAERFSVRKLTREINARFGKKKSQRRYLERTDDGGFRLYPIRYDPKTTSETAKKKMIEVLRDALGRLEAL